MRRVLLLAALLALPAQAERFTSERCKASFDVPNGWTVERMQRCKFGLKPRNWTPVEREFPNRRFGEYAIRIDVERKRFEDAARRGLFLREGKRWVITGRMGAPHPASFIRTPHWFGVKGSATVGYYSNERGYEGLDDLWRAVLSNGHWRTATIAAENPFSEAEFELVVRSFRFE